ncbi:M20 metallopeptidase family protein [Nonomuraea indica]|uniref:M20 metallopeptidase family protein n=1 Tax=Nonomuraea indica TaxID=1581193 RepID=UPI001FEA0D29|nr:M20 family metallopeptidase [Nonomuraea indica]
MTRPWDELRQRAQVHLPGLVALRRHLHTIPEVGLDLPRTQTAVLAALDGLPLDIRTGTACSSVVAVLTGARPGPAVLLRADMDALPVREESGEPFAATNGNMHACGHDLHMAGLVGAARLLNEARSRLCGSVVFVFQPGEEGYDGAQVMLDEGLLESCPEPPVAAYAVHVGPGRPGTLWTRPDVILAGMSELTVEVRGRGGHGSAPHRAADPVPVLCEIVGALQTYVTRRHSVFDPVVLTVTRLRAGQALNVIPDTASLGATVRTLSEAASRAVRSGVTELVRSIAQAHGAQAEVRFTDRYPVTRNDPAETAFVSEVAARLLGSDRVTTRHDPLMGSEDFARVLERVPGALAFLGTTPPNLDPADAPDVHSPHARFADDTLAEHAALLARLAADRLAVGDTGRPRGGRA